MKRTLPVLFALTLFFGFWFVRHPGVSLAAPPPKVVAISISSSSGKCLVSDPGTVQLSLKNKDRIKWCVTYDCQVKGVTVVIDDFLESVVPNQATRKRNPFGIHSARDNTFDFGPLNPGGRHCQKLSPLPTAKGEFKYRITVIGPDGAEVSHLDPGVIIGD